MCGRFNFSNHVNVKGIEEIGVSPSFNIAPSSKIAVLNEDMKCLKLNWGFTPIWMKQGQIINAKRETVRTKATYEGFRKCFVPINGWFEWLKTENGKIPYYFHSNYETMYVKSIMKENSVILLTTEAIDSISHIHNRMPLLSNEPIFKNWNLYPVSIDINVYEVSRKVSYTSINSPELINRLS